MGSEYLIDGPIDPLLISGLIGKMSLDTASGGHSIFMGQVRADVINGMRVKAIEYSAYEGMVKIEAEKIKKIILSEFNDVHLIEIVHSTGIVDAGSISLLVFVSAGHRSQAIEACRKSVELIKEMLPVWKKEILEDGTHEWRQNDAV